jgi:Lipocalin-like domain
MNSFALRVLWLMAVLWAAGAAYGAESPVLGVWKLTSYVREDVASGDNTQPWGENPKGHLMYSPDGHMSAIITSEGRISVAPTDDKYHEKTSQLFSTMAAYAGTYTVQGNKVNHHVEVACLPSWVGSEQPREITLDNDTLTIRTQPIRNTREGRDYIYWLVWQRVVSE